MLGGDPLFHFIFAPFIQAAHRHSFRLSSLPPKAIFLPLQSQHKRVNPIALVTLSPQHKAG